VTGGLTGLRGLVGQRERDTLELASLRASVARSERRLTEVRCRPSQFSPTPTARHAADADAWPSQLQDHSTATSETLDLLRARHTSTARALETLERSTQASTEHVALVESQYDALQRSFAALQEAFANRLEETVGHLRDAQKVETGRLVEATTRRSVLQQGRAKALERQTTVREEKRQLDGRFQERWAEEVEILRADVDALATDEAVDRKAFIAITAGASRSASHMLRLTKLTLNPRGSRARPASLARRGQEIEG
jgi:chromosome segregation ATPase